jgi:hypothetical protein
LDVAVLRGLVLSRLAIVLQGLFLDLPRFVIRPGKAAGSPEQLPDSWRELVRHQDEVLADEVLDAGLLPGLRARLDLVTVALEDEPDLGFLPCLRARLRRGSVIRVTWLHG